MSDERRPASAGDDAATDGDLARGLIDGDAACFDALYRRYARPVHDYALGIVRDRAVAEDVTQTTFLRAFEQRSSLREPDAVRGWLYRIAHNVAVNEVTRGVRAEEIDDDAALESPSPGPEQLAEQGDLVRLVWDAAASLEPRQRSVLDLSLRKGLSSAEIADVLGVDRAAASLAVHRSREALGNAVRYLAVARRRRHCDRLAALVPEGVRSLSVDQRLSVDRHMRRCPDCRETAAVLTAPAEMFASVPLALLPVRLLDAPRPHLPSRAPWRGRRPGRAGWLVGAAALVLAVGATVVATRHTDAGPGAGHLRATGASNAAATGPGDPAAPNAAAGPGVLTSPPDVAGFSYYGVSCPTSSECLATGQTDASRPLVSTTTDGGTTWTTSYPDVPSTLGLTSCSDTRSCVAAYYTDSVHLVRTADGGVTWTASPSPSVDNLQSMSCPSPTDCLAVGGADENGGGAPQAVATTDGGATWQSVPVPGPADAVSCPDVGHCWASGAGNQVWSSHDLGRTWSPLSPPVGMPAAGAPRGPFPANLQPTGSGLGDVSFHVDGVAFGDDTHGLAFGGSLCGGQGATGCPGGVWRTTDGGATWTFWTPTDTTWPTATFGACVGSACLLTASTFTSSELLSTADGESWSLRQALDDFAGRVTCSRDGALCVVIGHAGLLVTGGA